MKNEIVQTSLQQFLKHGIREMSIQKLVEPLGISTKTVYKYFKNKEELLEEALKLFHAQQATDWEQHTVGLGTVSLFFDLWYKGIENEYGVNNAFFHDLHYYYPDLGKRVEAALSKKFRQRFIQMIQQGIEEGVFREDVLPEVVFEGISLLYLAITREERFNGFRATPFELLLNTIALIIRGFCTETGRQQLDQHIQARQPVGKRKKPTETGVAQLVNNG